MATASLVGSVQADAETTGGWSGGGQEGELSYQGDNSYGGKVGSGTTRYSHTGASRNYSSGGANEGDHIIVILGSLTPGKLDLKANGGLGIGAGNDASNYGEWYVDGSDTKNTTTLFLPYIVNPSADFDIATGSFTTTGNPAQLNTADYYHGRFTATSGIMGNFNNGLVDQITIGTGLRLVGTSGVMQDLISFDEGTVGNRYGFLTTREGIIYMQGKIYLGSSGSSLVFDDADEVIVFPDVNVASTFFEILSENASNDITMDGFVIKSSGAARAALTHNAGTWLVKNTSLDNLRTINGGSGFTIEDTKISNSGQIVHGGMTLQRNQIISSDATSAVLYNETSDPSGKLDDIVFTSSGTGHAIELGTNTPTSITLVNHTYNGYAGVDGSTGNEVLYNNSGKAITVNISGGQTPTVRDGAGSSTTIVAGLTSITLTNLKADTEVRVYINVSGDNGTEIAGVESSGTSFNFTVSAGTVINIMINHLNYLPDDEWQFTVPAADVILPRKQSIDRQFLNP